MTRTAAYGLRCELTLSADGCLWELAPQSSPSPIYQYFPLSALVEYWEPRLPANTRRSASPPKLPGSSRSPWFCCVEKRRRSDFRWALHSSFRYPWSPGHAEALSSTSMRNPCGSFRMRHGLATPRPLDLRRARRVFWRPGVLLLRAPQSRWCLLLQRLWLAAAPEAVQPMSCGH